MVIIERLAAFAVGVLLPVLAACLLLSFMAGCSFQVGMDYYGQTGVDKRVQTELSKEMETWKSRGK